MAVQPKSRPQWAEELLKRAAGPVPAEVLERRRLAVERILANRVDIRPDKVADYIRAIREDEDED